MLTLRRVRGSGPGLPSRPPVTCTDSASDGGAGVSVLAIRGAAQRQVSPQSVGLALFVVVAGGVCIVARLAVL